MCVWLKGSRCLSGPLQKDLWWPLVWNLAAAAWAQSIWRVAGDALWSSVSCGGAGVCAMQVPPLLLTAPPPPCPPPVAQPPGLSGPWSVTFGLPMWLSGKESVCHWKRCKGHRFDPWGRKIPEGGNGNPLQYSCLENPMDRGDWPMGSQTVGRDLATEQAGCNC